MNALEDHNYSNPWVPKNAHFCGQCSYRSKTQFLLKKHMKRHNSAPLFNCMRKLRFKLMVKSKNVEISHSYICRACGFKTFSLIVYMKHVLVKCQICIEHNYCKESTYRYYKNGQYAFTTKGVKEIWQHFLHKRKSNKFSYKKEIGGFVCEICWYRSNNEKNTLSHIKKHANKFLNSEDSVEVNNIVSSYCRKCSHIHICIKDWIKVKSRVMEGENGENYLKNEVAPPEIWLCEYNKLPAPEVKESDTKEGQNKVVVAEKVGISDVELLSTEIEGNATKQAENEAAMPEKVWINEDIELFSTEIDENAVAMPEKVWITEDIKLLSTELEETATKQEKIENNYENEIVTTKKICFSETKDMAAGDQSINQISKFQCAGCSYRTVSETYLYEHFFRPIKVNAIYDCSWCSYVSPHLFMLKYHTLTSHDRTGEIEYECQACGFKTELTYILQCHLFSQHPDSAEKYVLCTFKVDETDKLYKCEGCCYTNYSKTEVEDHVFREHTNGEQYKPSGKLCAYCLFTTDSIEELDYHMLKKHQL